MTAALLPLMAACAEFPGAGTSSIAPTTTVAPEERVLARSPQSLENERFYGRVEQGLLTRGLLRADGGGPDTPFTSDMLARSFMALAFSQEFAEVGGRLVRDESESTLHRWSASVRLMPVFGPTVSQGIRAKDMSEIERLAVRLSRASRHPVGVSSSGGNFPILVLNQNELQGAGELLQRFLPGISETQIAFVENLPRSAYCVVLAADRGNDGRYTNALAVIRAELPDQLRTSCIHEEIAQGLGLSDDSPLARPSIFNDDDEFGRLTSMDELLLRILYDTRLAPGQSAGSAEPTVRAIARELVEGGVS